MKKTVAILFLLALTAFLLPAMEICPEKMQAVLIVKIIPFVRNFNAYESSTTLNVGVFGAHDILGFLQTAAKKVAYKVEFSTIAETNPDLTHIQILYIPSGVPPAIAAKLNALAKEKKILTVCGDPALTLDHNLTLSFYVNNDNPKILINLKSAKEEAINFSSNVLSLADIRNKGN